MTKVFVISGLSKSFDTIQREGELGKVVDKEYYMVGNDGPYHKGYVYLDTPENRKLFQDALAELKVLEEMHGSIMYGTLNKMKRP